MKVTIKIVIPTKNRALALNRICCWLAGEIRDIIRTHRPGYYLHHEKRLKGTAWIEIEE